MEKNKFFMNEEWNSSNYGMEIQSNELNCTPEQQQQLTNSFFNPNWDNSMDQGDPFQSALSSIVSSPAASAAGGESFVLRELIGRLGSICNSGEVTPKSYTGGHNSTNNSCYSTPLNSPPKLNLSTRDHHHPQIRGNFQIPGNQFQFPNSASFSTDPGFTDRAARFSSLNGQFGLNESEFAFPPRLTPIIESVKLSRVSSNHQSMKVSGSEKKLRRFSRSSTPPENGEFGDSRENSSVSEQIPGGEIGMKVQNDGIGRKRKSIPRGKGKETQSCPPSKVVAGESEESNSKRSKSDDENGKEKEDSEEKEEQKGNGKSGGEGNQKKGKENEKTSQEPPKDYIHVRARRGQATDSHSLAERVRREKISERMKFLQDLVPGCNKVTGKAVMLDEIINYVQSLQRQVEFLSMKLSTVNPRMDLINMEALLSKNIFQSGGSMAHSTYPSENSAPGLPYGYQSIHSGISNGIETPFSMKPLHHIDGFREAASQVSTFWEDDLQSVVQMGFNQNQQQSFPSAMANTHMKVEL